jgi:lycopene beta-cyclase
LPDNHSYDYIIAGGGAAGLSLAMHLLQSGVADGKKILIADREIKNQNDRTWCFWEDEKGMFDAIVYKHWNELIVYSGEQPTRTHIAPYTYKMIRGIDFYRYCHEQIAKHPGITVLNGEITAIETNTTGASVTLDEQVYEAKYVFSSILTTAPEISHKQHYLLQHFKGWIIETETDCFDADAAVFMDFRVPQQQDARFVYVLPFSKTKALVEYTIFSHDMLPDAEYDSALKDYIEQHITTEPYKITTTEKGVIPMTDYRFPRRNGHIIYTGTAGGNTRGSSGYTFKNIQKHSAAIAKMLQENRLPEVKNVMGKRAAFYDAVFLGVLGNGYCNGKEVFTRLFQKRKLTDVLRFMNGKASLLTELKIITAEPVWPFLRSAWKHITR